MFRGAEKDFQPIICFQSKTKIREFLQKCRNIAKMWNFLHQCGTVDTYGQSTISSLFVPQFCPSQGFGQRPPVDDGYAGITAARCVVAVFYRWFTHTDCLLQRNVPRPSWVGLNITETRFANFNSMLYNSIQYAVFYVGYIKL